MVYHFVVVVKSVVATGVEMVVINHGYLKEDITELYLVNIVKKNIPLVLAQ